MAALPTPSELAGLFRAWLDDNAEELAPFREPQVDTDQRVENLKALQALLFEAGWARYGWPEQAGGIGGDILHRAAVYEELARAGYPPRFVYEHLEVLLPTLVRFGDPDLMGELVPKLLAGEQLWCQGFSEPNAGSDLASLRTRAIADGDGWVINGHKIWTSWARWADRCLVVARTGTPESRHRGLTCFVVDVSDPGVTVTAINQSNGSPELAEVFFDDVRLDDSARIGEVDGGWGVAMYLLSCERGSFAWQRTTSLQQRVADFAPRVTESSDQERLGNTLADLFTLRARSWSTMRQLREGGSPGPESAVNKAFLSDTEQYLFETVDRIHPGGFVWADGSRDTVFQEEMLFAHAISIYGGTRQIQNMTIYRQLVSGGNDPADDPYVEAALAAVADTAGPAVGLANLGFAEVLADISDPDSRRGLAAVFEAQGRSAVHTPALADLLASRLDAEATLALATTPAPDGRHELIVDAAAADAPAVIAHSGDGWVRVAADDLDWTVEPHFLAAAHAAGASADLSRAEPVDATAVEEALALGRLALSFEALGASDAMFDVAAEHADQREQFGSTLNSFQAVQFMLAEAHIARTTLREVCEAALLHPTQETTAVAKLVAGRAGRRVGKETLQVLGAIGFTEEHPHHTWFHRVLAIDALLGRSAGLARELGARQIAEGGYPSSPRLADLPDA